MGTSLGHNILLVQGQEAYGLECSLPHLDDDVFYLFFQKQNEPAAIYPSSGYSPPRNKEAHVMMRPP
jgi:hypothetical protein